MVCNILSFVNGVLIFSSHSCTLLSRCLHELQPHGGRPLSCLLFCDNHKRQDPELVYTGAHRAFSGNGDRQILISGMQLFEF